MPLRRLRRLRPDDPEFLARRFEPVLFFHTAERFFPSDAKRYVEQCALWKALTPFDAKGSWTSLIPKSNIAAIDGEPGTFLGNNVVDTPAEERFFDLAGWKNAGNTYSDRAAVANDDDTRAAIRRCAKADSGITPSSSTIKAARPC